MTLFVDEGTIDRMMKARFLRIRALCSDRNFSIYSLATRADHLIESTEDESYELRLDGNDFERIGRPGTVVRFNSNSKDAYFAIRPETESSPFSSEPLLEHPMRTVRVMARKEWL